MKALQPDPPGGEMMEMLNRALIGAALLLAMLLVGVQVARAAEIIPLAIQF